MLDHIVIPCLIFLRKCQAFTAATPPNIPVALLSLTWHLSMLGREFSWLSCFLPIALETGSQNLLFDKSWSAEQSKLIDQ